MISNWRELRCSYGGENVKNNCIKHCTSSMSLLFALKRLEKHRKSFWSVASLSSLVLFVFIFIFALILCTSAWIMKQRSFCGRGKESEQVSKHDTARQLKAIIVFILIIGTLLSCVFKTTNVVNSRTTVNLALFDRKVKLQACNWRPCMHHQITLSNLWRFF